MPSANVSTSKAAASKPVSFPLLSLKVWHSLVGRAASTRITAAEIGDRILAGLPKIAFDRLQATLDVSTEELSTQLQIPRRTIARRKILKADESDRLFRIATLVERTANVMGGLDEAREWLFAKRPALGNKRPIDLAQTDVGLRSVETLLGQIEHGIFA